MSDSNNKTDCLVFALFCPKQQSLQLFNKIQSIHNHWFKNVNSVDFQSVNLLLNDFCFEKLSKSPLNCELSMAQSGEDSIQCSLNYKTQEMEQTVEELVYYGYPLAQQKFGITDCDLISCNINLDNCLLSFLCDAFTQKTNKNQKCVKVCKRLTNDYYFIEMYLNLKTENEIRLFVSAVQNSVHFQRE